MGIVEKKDNLRFVRDGVSVVFGTLLLCLSVEMFLLPYHFLSGGVAGVSVALFPITGIDTTWMANALTVILLAIGAIVLGRDFFIKTAVSSLLYPIFNILIARFISVPEISPVLASFYGGLLGGAGVGIVIRTGASTGGMDVPPLIIHKLTQVRIGTLIMIVDGLTVFLGLYTYGLSAVLIGLISVFSSSYAVNRMLSIGEGARGKQIEVISPAWDSITDDVTHTLNRSATIVDTVGGFLRNENKMLLIIVDNQQYGKLLDIIRRHDPRAFVVTTDVSDMHGQGWTYTVI